MKFFFILFIISLNHTAYIQSAEEYLVIGNEKLVNKNYSGAIEDFTKAIELNPNYADAYYNRGLCKFYSINPSPELDLTISVENNYCFDWMLTTKNPIRLSN